MRDSIVEIRKAPLSGTLEQAVGAKPATALGRAGSPQEYLYRLIRYVRPDRVVETGVYWGISSAFILAALADNRAGTLTSIDLPPPDRPVLGNRNPPLRAGEPVGFVIPSELRDRWTLVVDDVRHALPGVLDRTGKVDVFFHDAGHTYEEMLWEFTQADPHLSAGALLLADDVDVNRSFTDFLGSHPRYRALGPPIRGRLGAAVVVR